MKRDMDLVRELRDGHARLEKLLIRLDGGDLARLPHDQLNSIRGTCGECSK
jgi:hypothetical protein